MQLFFIDESGTIPPQNKTATNLFFTLGGVIIPEDHWHEIEKEMIHLKNHYKVEGEIKWRYFAKDRSEVTKTPLSHLAVQEKEELRNALYTMMTKFKSVKLISVVVDVRRAYLLDYVQTENDLYWFAYKQMTERFQYHLQDISRVVGSKINGIIICDHRQPKDDLLLRHLHQKLLTRTKLHHTFYDNLVEGVFMAPSHLSVGIQFADLVAGAVFRKYVRNDNRYFNLIRDSFRKSSTGKIEGYGLVKWPK